MEDRPAASHKGTTLEPIISVKATEDFDVDGFADAIADAIIKAENEYRKKLGLPPLPKE